MNTVIIEDLILPATSMTPEIVMNPMGHIWIKGRAMNSKMTEMISRRLDEWIGNYSMDPAETTTVDFSLEYLSTSNISIYINLLGKLKSVLKSDRKLVINWHYDDDDIDIFEKGEDISNALNIPVRFCKNFQAKNGD
jgi:hypothetical protein